MARSIVAPATGHTAKSGPVAKKLQLSDIAWRSFAASSDCGASRYSQTRPINLHPVWGASFVDTLTHENQKEALARNIFAATTRCAH